MFLEAGPVQTRRCQFGFGSGWTAVFFFSGALTRCFQSGTIGFGSKADGCQFGFGGGSRLFRGLCLGLEAEKQGRKEVLGGLGGPGLGRPWKDAGGPGSPGNWEARKPSRKLQAREASRGELRGLKGPYKKDDLEDGLGYLRVTRQRPAGLTAQPTAAARRRALGSRAASPAGFGACLGFRDSGLSFRD